MTYRLKTAFFSLLLMLMWTSQSLAQSLNITVKDHENKALPGATVQLISLKDSVSMYAVTDLKGKALFSKTSEGLHTLKISFIGFNTLEKSITIKNEGGGRNLEYRLTESSTSLDAVTITAVRPLIRQEGDKMIIDPIPLAGISTNTLEVLESTPGLYVDQDGGIFLTSATPAVVYINGREQKLSSQDISNLLHSLPPESIQRIEVMRTPSTKYDAASSGGVINIVLKKGVKIGRFGSVNAGLNQGVYGNRNAGFSFNNSGEKTTFYLNSNLSNNNGLEELNTNREMASDTNLSQSAKNTSSSNQLYLGYGLTYDFSEKMSFSYDGRINLNHRKSNSVNNNLIEASLAQRLAEIENILANTTSFMSLQQEFGLVLKFDTLGSEWDSKFSYNVNTSSSTQDYTTEYVFPVSFAFSGDGKNLQNRHFLQLQSDFSYFFPHDISLETGFKSTWQYYGSDADFFRQFNGISTIDSVRTRAFDYRESVNAAYLQASKKLWLEFQLKTGVRMEHTYMKGHQKLPGDTSFLVSRSDWFPYVYLSRPLFSMGGVTLQAFAIYRRTISRPGYQSLNPYISYVDQFMYETGNPALKPQFTDNYEINVSFNDMPVFAVGKNQTTDIFSSVIYRDKKQSQIAVRTYDNLGKNTETYFRAVAGIPPGKRYFFALGAQYNLNHYQGVYENQPLEYTRANWRFFTFHSLKLFKETKLNMSGFMMVKGNYNFFELENFGALNFGITQTFLDKALTITLNIRDALGTMKTRFELKQGSIPTYGDRYTDNRRIGLSIRYNFGIRKKEEDKKKMPEDMED